MLSATKQDLSEIQHRYDDTLSDLDTEKALGINLDTDLSTCTTELRLQKSRTDTVAERLKAQVETTVSVKNQYHLHKEEAAVKAEKALIVERERTARGQEELDDAKRELAAVVEGKDAAEEGLSVERERVLEVEAVADGCRKEVK